MVHSLRLSIVCVFAAWLLPSPGLAQFDASNPAEVALGLFPFETDSEEDRSLAFLLEDYVAAKLPRKIGHPVVPGREIVPAIPQGIDGCVSDGSCVRLLGGQFNVSLAARVRIRRSGSEIQLDVDFYTTGNGLRIARETTAFRAGDEAAMVDAFAAWFALYFDTSLRVSTTNRAGEGGVMSRSGSSSSDEERVESYRDTRRKKVSSRRTDFGDDREDRLFDRRDPTADLRAIASEEEDEDDGSEPRTLGRGTPRSETDSSTRRRSDSSRQDAREVRRSDRDSSASTSIRSRPIERDEELDLDSQDARDRSVSSFSEAERAGYGPREYKRYTRSGLTLDQYGEQRWTHGGRFYLRLGAFYGAGSLTRRYATVVFVRVGDVKTDEYGWERLGPSQYGNPGGGLGVGYAPIDFLAVELDVSLMYAQQDLRREYNSHDLSPPTNIPQHPQSMDTAHIALDLRARALILPKKRVKPNAGLGLTLLLMQGFTIQPEEILEYTSRPLAGVLGLTPIVGVSIAASPFVSFYVDVAPTVYLAQGATRFEEQALFNGVTEGYLPEEDKQPPIDSPPLMVRAGLGAMIMF